ncbi:MAG: C25 family cysteine peptidase [Candidatus Poribacteria bacterium]|nr:C25 family cysteine peptidase [Candidatus Poribacteria bacterium]
MQTRLTKICTRLPILFITLFLYAEIGNLPIMPPIDSKNVAVAAPLSSKQRPRVATRKRAKTQREIELVSSTSQGVTIQLVIPKSDFSFDNKPGLFSGTETGTGAQLGRDAQISDFESPTISFPGCRFTTELGMLRLPIQSTLIGVPADTHFQLRIVEKDFSTHKVEDLMSTSNFSTQLETREKKDNFFPENLVKIGEASQIRENRVLPVQLNPVQYNPIRREIRLHHRLVVEIRFSSTGTHERSTVLSTIPRSLHTESTVYDAIFDDMLINPQSANRWRSPIQRAPAAPSISPTGPRYRIRVTESAMYSITGQDLAAAGANLGTITPTTLTLTNKGNQIPIFVRGEDDQSFDPTDEIIFYGERQHGETSYLDPYSDENIYWLSWNTGRGIRMVTKTPLANANNAQPYSHFLTRVHFEKDREFRRFRNANLTENQVYTEFSQGLQQRFFTLTELPPLPNDSWFWAQLSAPASKPFSFMLPGVEATARPATVRVALHGRSNTEHDCNVWLNDKIELGEARWNGETEYQLQNPEIFQSFLNNGKNTIRITNPTSAGAFIDILMLNWIQIDYWRNFEAEKDVLPFAITPLLDETGAVNPNFEVQLKNFSTPDIEIYGIDGTRYVGLSPIADDKVPGTYKVLFQSSQIRPKRVDDPTIQYIALTRNQFRKPKISVDAPSDLRSTQNGADYIIITHKHFLQDVQPLADFRRQQGMRTKIVDVQNIYDEFNHGILTPKAIREFLSYAYHNWQPPAPTYVLLVGDTDIKNKIDFVPTMQVQIPGYGSSASDHQFVTFRGTDSFPDMLIGRMPANNRVDARIFVERAINYETAPKVGPWHKRFLMLAGSDIRFHWQTNGLISNNQLSGRYEIQRIYAPYTEGELTLRDDDVLTPIGRRVIDGFNDGASIVNYIGHGGGGRWASSRMLDFKDPEQNLTNISQLPFVISMTCYTGSFDGIKNSLAEELLRSENGGAIAVIGATSIGLLDGDYLLNLEIFDVIFNDQTHNIGAIVAQAKTQFLINASKFLDLAEVFTLFGDPATNLRIPRNEIQVTADMSPFQGRNASQGDTLLSVSATLPERLSNADVEITLVPTTETAVANNIVLEQEPVAIVNGQISTQIRVPSDPEFDVGAVQIYAWDADEEAIGHATYDILSRYVKNVRLVPFPVPLNQPTHLYAETVDKNAIDEMTLFWSEDGNSFFTIPVVPHRGATYRSERPIPGYPDWQTLDYYLEVKVKTGRTFQTEITTYDVGDVEIEVDLALLDQTFTWNTTPPFTLSAQIRNIEIQPVRNVPVQFFVKALKGETNTASVNTPTTSILEELKDATPIGDLQIIPEILPGNQVIVSVPWQPPPGDYLVTVYVDPTSAELPKGSIIEKRERNNWASKQFSGNRIILTPETRNPPIQSPDGLFQVTIPSGSIQTSTVLTYTEETLTITNQPDIAVAIPTSAIVYQLGFIGQTELTANATFLKEGSNDPYIYRRDEDNGNWIRVGGEILSEKTISAEVKLPGTFALLSHSDTSPPMVELTFEHQGFVDGDYVSDTPTISARIEDANGVDSRPKNIVLTKNGESVPQDEYVIAASPTNNNLLLITYTPVLEPGEYRIRLQAQDANGNISDAERNATVAGEFEITNIANFPNPFVPGSGTHFAYYLTESADEVSLKIYTITGRRIIAIDTLDASVSYNEFHYDGRDADGELLANGVYLYKFTARKGDVRKQKFGKIAVRK